MRRATLLCLLAVFFLSGCYKKPLPPVSVQMPTREIDYLHEVKPILEKRCVVCHSCYNSPCQLKLSSFEGVERGATKEAVYNASRLRSMDPTRLFIDAQTTDEWRQKGFKSVTKNSAPEGFNDSLMLQLLSHKMQNPVSTGEYFSEKSDLTCAENNLELGSYLQKHPNRGMPFGFPPLKESEFEVVAGWLVQGAQGPTPSQQAKIDTVLPSDEKAIRKWEKFLNTDDAKYGMTARYLYEHLFLAHITFGSGSKDFYELVRSTTPPEQPIKVIAAVRPYDDPGPSVYYRFRKITSAIVYKTHMVFELNDAQLLRYDELFIKPPWLQEPYRVGYDPVLSANPFSAFEQIPPRSRYQFLLDNAQYIIMTFIRGPVCKGQVALNVIHDNFWIMFLDPDFDLSVQYPAFLRVQRDNLRMPVERGSDLRIFSAITDEHRKLARRFYRARQNFYGSHYYNGLGYEAIWKGNKKADSPLLTVFRHFDSASVHKGVLGDLPRTMWVIDYPLLERIYYSLVAGFDVYGTAGHQLAVRLYMDGLRREGESYFLDFLPSDSREETMREWYTGMDFSKVEFFPAPMPSAIAYITPEPKREFMEYIVGDHLPKDRGIGFDPVNYLAAGEEYPPLPERYLTQKDYLQAFHSVSRPGTSFFTHVTDHNANVAYVRIRVPGKEDLVVSIVINRWHDNVTFLFGEEGTLDPLKDKADFIEGFIGSYPNTFLDVNGEDLPDFFATLANFDGSPKYMEKVGKYVVNRSDPKFWEVYDWFQERFNQSDPVHAGLFDLNRYYHLAK